MKIIQIIFYFFMAILIFISCSKENGEQSEKVKQKHHLSRLKNKKNKLLKSYDSLGKEIAEIDLELIKLDTTKKVPLVSTIVLKDTVFKHFIEAQGSIDTRQNIVLNSEYSGTLTRLSVKEGDQVYKGQTIAKIDDGGLSLRLAQQKSQLDLARTTFERQKRLWDQKIGSEIQYLQAKTQYESLKNNVGVAKAQLDKTEIKAPFSGIIDQVLTEQGQVVIAGQSPVVRLINLTNMYIKTDIPENYISEIKTGNAVEVYIASLNRMMVGRIRRVGNYINPNNRTFSVEVSINNVEQSLKPNLIAHIKINDYIKENALILPENIIRENAEGEQFVFQLMDINQNKEGVVHKVKIKTGVHYNSSSEVLGGLKSGAVLVNEGAKNMRDGLRVKIIEKQ